MSVSKQWTKQKKPGSILCPTGEIYSLKRHKGDHTITTIAVYGKN